jgi:hypothetical protein
MFYYPTFQQNKIFWGKSFLACQLLAVSLNFGHVITLDNRPNLTQINLKTDLQHDMKVADGSGSR